jgi:hypothetical protein
VEGFEEGVSVPWMWYSSSRPSVCCRFAQVSWPNLGRSFAWEAVWG